MWKKKKKKKKKIQSAYETSTGFLHVRIFPLTIVVTRLHIIKTFWDTYHVVHITGDALIDTQ